MTVWVLNAIGLLATTIGALVVFLHLHRTTRSAAGAPWPEACAPLAKDRRLLMITMGLMSAWFVVQYAALILT
jgi:hypothetical protein